MVKTVQATELRLGNWIQYIHKDGYVQVSSLRKQEVKDGALLLINSLLPEHIVPIPLDASILEKCGFVKGVFFKEECWVMDYLRPLERKPKFIKQVKRKEYANRIFSRG